MDWAGAGQWPAVAILFGMIWLAGAAWRLTCDYRELQRALRHLAPRRPGTSHRRAEPRSL